MLNSATLLHSLPATLRDELLGCYKQIVTNYVEQRWEPAELNGGKICEVVYTILKGALSGTYAAHSSKPNSMVDASRALETTPPDPNRPGDRSLRILMPRLLPFLYEIRNNRGVGHVGGDVNPNQEDAEAVLSMSNWLMAELVRIFHGVSLTEAQVAVDGLVQKRHPLVWASDGTKRVLDPKMKTSDQVLVLLYSETNWIDVKVICDWVEYKSASMFKTRVLNLLHFERLVEHDQGNSRVKITPRGVRRVEDELLHK